MQDIAQALRINRNIVECKVSPPASRFFISSCINRNIVECKVYYVSVFRDPAHVLIETLWNVKLFQTPMQPYSFLY